MAYSATMPNLFCPHQDKNAKFELLLSAKCPHPFDSHNNSHWRNNLFFWENSICCYAVCLQNGCHFLQLYEVSPAFSLSATSLAFPVHPENEQGTQFNSIIFCPLLHHFLSASLISLLSFAAFLPWSFCLSICFLRADNQLSWRKSAQVAPGCLPSILTEGDREDGIGKVVKQWKHCLAGWIALWIHHVLTHAAL